MRDLKFRFFIYGKMDSDMEGFNESLGINEMFSYCEQNGYKVMQYTGLKDAKGVEIYDGDIIYLAGYGNYICEFPFIQLYDSAAEGDVGEILGNVHENPELLK